MTFDTMVWAWTTTIAFCLGLQKITAFSTGAGSCVGGEPAVGSPHRTASFVYEASLRELTYDLTINGESTLGLASLPLMQTGAEYLIEVKGYLARFRGALLRVEAEDAGTLMEFLPHENSAVADVCDSIEGVLGITHTDATVKQTLSGMLRVNNPTTIFLDVTVVGANNADNSLFGFQRLSLGVVDVEFDEVLEEPITAAPVSRVSSPTSPPSVTPQLRTGDPSPAPSRKPTFSPTLEPTGFPTMAPTLKPTDLPTTAPTRELSALPTAAPVPTLPEKPEATFAPVSLTGTTEVTYVVENLQLEMYNITELSVDERFKWESVTGAWFEEYFAQNPVDGIVRGSMKTSIRVRSFYVDEKTDGFAYVIGYDQELVYRAPEDEVSGIDPLQYVALPFETNGYKEELIKTLSREMDIFQNVKSFDGPIVEISSSGDPSFESARISDGAIVSIVVVLAVMVFAGGITWVMMSNHLKTNIPDNIPDTFSFMGSLGSRKLGPTDAM